MTITVRFERTNVQTRWPCVVCDGFVDKDEYIGVAMDEHGNSVGDVCDLCIKGGGEGAAFRLRIAAQQLEDEVQRKRQLARQSWQIVGFDSRPRGEGED